MELSRYFDTDDGSLPEILITFADSQAVKKAFVFLFACGARDVTVDGGKLWLTTSQSEKAFLGPSDIDLVISGAADPFHVVLGEITFDGRSIPDLGLFVDPTGFTLDYRMGSPWDAPRIQALLGLLRRLAAFGGAVSFPWWDANGERVFLGGAKWRLTTHSSGRLRCR